MRLAELDLQVTLAELEQIAGAYRRPLPWERHVDFAGIESTYDRAYDAAASVLAGLQQTIVAALASAITGITDPARLAEAIRMFASTQPADVASAVDAAIDQLVEILAEVHWAGAVGLVGEAAAAGAITAAAAQHIRPRGVFRDDLLAVAANPPTLLWQKVATAAVQANTPTATATDAIRAAAGASPNAAVDQARQAAHVVHGEGRMSVVDQLPTPDRVYSSELLDKRTCAACRQVDGREYDSMKSGLADYPNAGPYIHCHGETRCRGTLVLTWGETDNTVDGPPPPGEGPNPNPIIRKDKLRPVEPPPPVEEGPPPSSTRQRIHEAADIVQVQNVLQQHLAGRGKVELTNPSRLRRDRTELDLDRVKAAAARIADLFDAHPHINADIVVKAKLRKGVLAQANTRYGANDLPIPGSSSMELSRQYLLKSADTATMFAHEVEHGHFRAIQPGVTPHDWIVTHEFGHLLHYTVKPDLHPSRVVAETLWGDVGDVGIGVHGYPQYRADVSGYGRTSDMELVAEAYADVTLNGGAASTVNQAVTADLEAKIARRYPG